MTETRGSTAAPESGRPDADDESADEAARDGSTTLTGGSKTRDRGTKESGGRRRSALGRTGDGGKGRKKPSKRRFRPGLFVRQIVAELRKVVWPTRHELTTYTSVVIVFVAIIIAIVSALDFGISKAVLAVFG